MESTRKRCKTVLESDYGSSDDSSYSGDDELPARRQTSSGYYARYCAEKNTVDQGGATNQDIENATEWNRHFFELVLYKANHGTMMVKSEDQESRNLYKWCLHQRKYYRDSRKDPSKKIPIMEDRVKALETVQFSFATRGDENWMKNYDKLKLFKGKHGNLLVPRKCEFAGLGEWVIKQRLHHKENERGKSTALTPDRTRLLDDIGFIWQVRVRPGWETRFDELVTFKNTKGHTKVPQNYPANKALGKWVAKQREQYKNMKLGKYSYLTSDRIGKLNELGFVWCLKGGTVDGIDI